MTMSMTDPKHLPGRIVEKGFIPPRSVLALGMLMIMASVLSVTAYRRNAVYVNETALWQDVVEKSPNKFRAHNMLGNLLRERGSFVEAAERYAISIAIEPNAKAYNNPGLVYAAQGQQSKAIDQYRSALTIDPDLIEAHLNLAIVYLGRNDMHNARTELDIILQLDPHHVQARNFLAYLLSSGHRR
jgi:protein O-mannosyl-transferase